MSRYKVHTSPSGFLHFPHTASSHTTDHITLGLSFPILKAQGPHKGPLARQEKEEAVSEKDSPTPSASASLAWRSLRSGAITPGPNLRAFSRTYNQCVALVGFESSPGDEAHYFTSPEMAEKQSSNVWVCTVPHRH